jgi:hypothetical protein
MNISTLLSTSATSLLYLRYKLAKAHSFITSLIYLEPGLSPQLATPSCLAEGTAIHLSRICEWLFDWLGFIDQVLGSMIHRMDYHQNVYRTPQVISIYLMASA